MTARKIERGDVIVVKRGTSFSEVKTGSRLLEQTTRYSPDEVASVDFTTVFIGYQVGKGYRKKMALLRRDDLSIVGVDARLLKNLESPAGDDRDQQTRDGAPVARGPSA